jgi:glycosyltransferase involved in cell wall biosynthesis
MTAPAPPSIYCIIPCYNEAGRVARVLEAILQVDGLQGVIAVDDGSTDATAAVLDGFAPRVEVLRLEANRGKAAAVLHAALAVAADFLLLVDADLRGARPAEFARAVAAVRLQPDIDLLVLRRVNKDAFTRLLRGDLLITGERIVRRTALLATLQARPVQGYQLEVALNDYMLQHDGRVCWLPVSSVGDLALRKLGFWRGLRKEAAMFLGIYRYLGARRLFYQMRKFARCRCSLELEMGEAAKGGK